MSTANTPDASNRLKMSGLMHLDMCHALAQDFKRSTRYAAFDTENAGTFSIEYVRLFLDTCSEIESLGKLFCDRLAPGQLKADCCINDWRSIVVEKRPLFPSVGIEAFNQHVFQPWLPWGDTPRNNPEWWKAYNDVKHDRSSHFQLANMQNVVLAICGMMVFASQLFPNHYFGHEQPWFKVREDYLMNRATPNKGITMAAADPVR
jgi:hypothetical protein